MLAVYVCIWSDRPLSVGTVGWDMGSGAYVDVYENGAVGYVNVRGHFSTLWPSL